MNTLGGHPAHRTWDIALGVVDGVVWGQLPQQTKVCHFTQFILPHYDIPCGKVLYIKLEEGEEGGIASIHYTHAHLSTDPSWFDHVHTYMSTDPVDEALLSKVVHPHGYVDHVLHQLLHRSTVGLGQREETCWL